MIKIYYKRIYISKDVLRISKLNSKHFKTNYNLTIIIPLFLWKIIEVYNGKKYIPININKKKIGFRLKKFIFKKKNKFSYSEFNIKLNTLIKN
uniref:Ribosomal protein S19 n=1 Tax=Cyclospora cayetanensis TaxID=88456 RepID=A0A193BMD6_9EIME|nr:ribosomal protein S19 [Cyclospora cayetanensis]ANN13265.1 ribosomal protein S19 [Cyclospora cayetanensis]ANN13294.1 ribosomal protein S19 [Cyclospora cayetanensis]ANN13323.1 ribosomal protein S19 [Cyclospora cayetanensis]ANN13352.1 ribosomal protein S19 [Cyclospora cayetanensis]